MTFMEDPRLSIIKERVKGIRHVVPVVSYKGGVGKSLITALTSLRLSELYYKVGVLDMDFTNPSIHIVLGLNLDEIKPKEERGVVPPDVGGTKVMTLAYYTRDNPIPLRGPELVNVFRELMSITLWGELDFLLIDTPPTFSDILLELFSSFRGSLKPVIVSAFSKLSLRPSINLHRYMREINIEPLGVVINFFREEEDIKNAFDIALMKENVRILGVVREDKSLERAIGSVEDLRKTKAYVDVTTIVDELLKSSRGELK